MRGRKQPPDPNLDMLRSRRHAMAPKKGGVPLDPSAPANTQPWWINATDRPPEFDAICDALVNAGLCSWDGSRHPQSYALVVLWAMSEAQS